MYSNFIASAPGKIILAGEHSVVHGTRALATVVDKRSFSKFTTSPLPIPLSATASSAITIDKQSDVSLSIAYPGYSLVHLWQHADLFAHRDTFIKKCMTDIVDYTPCDQQHDTADGSNDPHLASPTSPYFTSEQKFIEYVQDHTHPGRHLLHKHHATLDKLTDIFDALYPQLNVTIMKFCHTTEQFTQVEASSLHASHEICPSKVFLLFYYLLLLTQPQLIETIKTTPLHCQIISQLPMGSGLGSSASVSSSLASGFYHILRNFPTQSQGGDANFKLTNADLRVVNTWAFQGERLIHGTPSGVDNTCTVYGGVIAFRRVNGESVMDFLPAGAIPSSIQIFITNTKQPKNTKTLVAGVHALKKSYQPVVQAIFDSIEQITEVLLTCIKDYINRESTFLTEEDVYATFRDVLRINQQLLNALGVGHAKIDDVVKISNQFDGQLTTKLTGAGGGGCVITLTRPNIKTDILNEFTAQIEAIDMDVISTIMGQDGVTVYPMY